MLHRINLLTTLGLFLVRPLALPAQIQVAQESAAEVGDFDANVLGTINPFVTSLSTTNYYNFGGRFTFSFGPPLTEPQPTLVESRAHLFLVDTSDGLSMFHVLDEPTSAESGTADTAYTLSGDTAEILAYDETPDYVGTGRDFYTSDGMLFTADHQWVANRTDGLAIGSLDGAGWSMFVSFTAAPTGLSDWHAISADGNSLILALEPGRRVRLQPVAVSGIPTLMIVPAGPEQVTISWTPDTPGFLLQETPSLPSLNWMNSPSGADNPVTVPASENAKFYRLFKP